MQEPGDNGEPEHGAHRRGDAALHLQREAVPQAALQGQGENKQYELQGKDSIFVANKVLFNRSATASRPSWRC
jgi:hypothetical protein